MALVNREYWQYRAADFLVRLLPRRWSYWIGTSLSDVCFRRDERGRAAVINNLRQIYAYKGIPRTDEELWGLAHETFRNFGKYLADFFWFTNVRQADLPRLVTTENGERIGEAAALERGVLCVTAHLGNWEIGGAVLALEGYPMNVVVAPMRDQKTDALFESRRARRGFKVIPLGRAALGVLAALRRREFVAVLADRDYTQQDYRIEFMGREARLPIGPAKLAAMTGAPILPGFLCREPGDRFKLKMCPLIRVERGGSADAVESELARTLEGIILEYPTQWFIFEDFWKSA